MTDGTERLALAEHWLSLGRPQDALRELDRAGQVATGPDGLALRGRAALHLGDPVHAVDCARRGLAVAPDDVALLGLLASGLGSQDDLEGAERALLGALRQVPDAPGLLVYYVDLLTRAGQYDKAERVLDRAARLAPDDPAVLSERADLALARGRRREARWWSQQALARGPEHRSARISAGAVALEAGEVTQASRHLRSAAAADLANPDLRSAARLAGYLAHPLMVPLRLPARIGLFGTYALGLALVLLGVYVGGATGSALIGLWLLFALYSWVVPPLLRAWLRRRGRL